MFDGDLATGLVLGRYRLEERIGAGGMGSVWRARDQLLERDVALKVLPRALVTDPLAERRFEREARALGRLQHQNVVGIYDLGTADPGTGEELPFLVMELVRGRPLSDLIADRPDLRRVLIWMEQVARALSAAHAAGIVHRDLKPSNIMVDDEDHVVVLDFGLARLAQRDGDVREDTLTTPGMVLGSCPYMAPEQALGQGVSPASDLFSFGTVLYEALSGERAFTGDTPMRALQAVVRCSFTPVEDLVPGLPTPLYEIVDRCLERDPSDRYGSAGELGKDLAAVLAMEASSPSLATTLVQPTGVSASRLRRNRRRRRLAAVALVAALSGGGLAWLVARVGWEPVRPDPGLWSTTELLEGPGSLFRPAWSANGALIAVGRTDDERAEVLVVPTDGGEPRVLVEGGGRLVPGYPDFSPDSAAIVVSVLSGSDQIAQVLPTVGGPPVAEIDNALHAVWLDRSTLAFSRVVDGRSSIWSYSLENGQEALLVDALEGVSWWEVTPRPGGGFALLGGATDINQGVFVCDDSGRDITRWLAPGRVVRGVDWAPGGQSLLASVDGQLVRLGTERLQPLLPSNQETLQFPAFSDDGRRLAAVHSERSYDIVSVDPDGGPPACLICDVPRAGWGSRAPDGSVVFRRDRGGESVVMVRGARAEMRALTEPGESASCPVVSPDGTRVAYLAEAEGATELRVRPLAGGDPVTLARHLEKSEFVSWSPDGGSIAFAGGSPLRVWVVSAAGGDPRAVTEPGGDYPSWSPDGSQIAFAVWTEASDPNQGTWVVSRNGNNPRKLSDVPSRVIWDPRSGRLLQLRRSEGDDSLELWQTDADGSGWSLRSRLDLGVRPPIQMEFRPLTVDPGSGRLVMNRPSVTSRLLVFDGVEADRW